MVSPQPFSLVFDSTMVLIHVSGRWGLLENKRSSGYMVVVVVMGEVVGGVVGEGAGPPGRVAPKRHYG